MPVVRRFRGSRLNNAEYRSRWTGSAARELLVEDPLAVRLPHDELARRTRQGCIDERSTGMQRSRNQDMLQHRRTVDSAGDDRIRRGAKKAENDRVRVVTAQRHERESQHPTRLRRVEAGAAASARRRAGPVDGDGKGEVEPTLEAVALTGDGERATVRQCSVRQLSNGDPPDRALR